MPGKCSFNPLWLYECGETVNKWLCPVAIDKYKGYCKICKSTFDVSHSGLGSVRVHEKGKKHKSLVDALVKGIQTTLSFKNTDKETSPLNSSANKNSPESSVADNYKSNSHKASNLNNFVVKNEVIKAEIIWSLHVALSHSSNRTGGNASDLFKIMFPDSVIAEKFKMQKDKLAYVITYGLGPFFQNELINKVNKCSFYCFSLDESLNKVAQKEQMDVIIRFWDNSTNQVSTRYLTSAFLDRSKASDLLYAFNESISELGLSCKNILQIETDGPNVNIKFLRDFEQHMKNFTDDKILDIGTCSLHVVHNSYKTAHNKSGWKINEFLRSLYYLFKDFPSRRADYTHFSKSKTFPLKLCTIRWIENSKAIERAIKILPCLEKYVEGVRKNPPATKNFEIVSNFVSDELLLAKLYFLQSVASELEAFLTKFQSDKPLLPFLYSELSGLIKNISLRCLKKELCFMKNFRNLMTIDIHNVNNHIPFRNTDIGFRARGALSSVSEAMKIKFLKESRQFLLAVLEKLRVKSPLCKALVKGASCFCPDIMLNESLRSSRISLALKELIAKNQVSPIEADSIKKTYEKICNDPNIKVKLQSYNPKTDRLDCFFMDILYSQSENDPFFLFLKKILTMFHGNAAVERGFSVNKECVVENLQEPSLIAQRAIYSALLSSGGIKNLSVTKNMISYFCSASSKRQDALKEKKKHETTEELSQKQITADLKELKKRKLQIMQQAEEEAEELQKKIVMTEKKLKQ